MNKRKKKRVLAWWDGLHLHEKSEYFGLVLPKSKNKYHSATEQEKEAMYDWAMN